MKIRRPFNQKDRLKPIDKEFFEKLCAHLDKKAVEMTGKNSIAYPMLYKRDGTIDRERTLALKCYAGLDV